MTTSTSFVLGCILQLRLKVLSQPRFWKKQENEDDTRGDVHPLSPVILCYWELTGKITWGNQSLSGFRHNPLNTSWWVQHWGPVWFLLPFCSTVSFSFPLLFFIIFSLLFNHVSIIFTLLKRFYSLMSHDKLFKFHKQCIFQVNQKSICWFEQPIIWKQELYSTL